MRELVASVIANLPPGNRPRLRFTLAESPIWDPSLRLLGTLRVVPFKTGQAKLSTPASYGLPAKCAVRDLQCWQRGGCPETTCVVKIHEIGSTYRQKMVD